MVCTIINFLEPSLTLNIDNDNHFQLIIQAFSYFFAHDFVENRKIYIKIKNNDEFLEYSSNPLFTHQVHQQIEHLRVVLDL